MRLVIGLIAALLGTAPVAADDVPRARFLDAEEMMSGLPEVEAGIVYRVPGNTVLLLDAGAAVGVDFSITLIGDPGMPADQFFTQAGEIASGRPRSVAMVTTMIGDLLYAEVAACVPSEFEDGTLTCTADRNAGSFVIDMNLSPPNLAFTVTQRFSLSDDPTYTKAGKKTLSPWQDVEPWTVILPVVE